jgi:hypothetical protein
LGAVVDEPQIIDSGPVVLKATTGNDEVEQEVDDGSDRSGAGE